MVDTIYTELGNPFLDDTKELVSLSSNTHQLITVIEIKNIGLQQYQKRDSLIAPSQFNETIPKNKLAMIKDRPGPAVLSKSKLQLKSANSDCQLFSRLSKPW